jgi:hypothetical protein
LVRLSHESTCFGISDFLLFVILISNLIWVRLGICKELVMKVRNIDAKLEFPNSYGWGYSQNNSNPII